MYDYLIVGAGLFGSIFAYEMNKNGFKVLVIEKRNHIGGNCYTEPFEDYHIHKYGPHIFHTSNKEIWDYVNNLVKIDNFSLRNKANIDNKIYSIPINLSTIHQIWPEIVTPEQAREKIKKDCVFFSNAKNFEQYCLSTMGKTLYKMFFYGYTKKQWGKDPKLISADVAKRIPLRLDFDDRYYHESQIYEGMPSNGYTEIFEVLLKNIEVINNVDFLKDKSKYKSMAKKILFTGPIDAYFDYIFGDLEYRTLSHYNQILQGDFQGTAVVNYPSEKQFWTRIIQHKHFHKGKSNKDYVTIESSSQFDKKIHEERFYPINDDTNNNLYQKYKAYADENEPNVIFGGRLGEYKYYDMDKIIEKSLDLVSKELEGKNSLFK
jgi:UDP-galactopyranose mutase